jgi:uncharacterized membrane protein
VERLLTSVRFYEIDAVRGSAIIAMISFHLFYDLDFMGYYDMDTASGFWWALPRAIASVFIFIAGVSLALSYSSGKVDFRHYAFRGLWIFMWGLVITFVTYIAVPYAYIRFGILHFMGLAAVLSYPLLKGRAMNLVLGFISIVLGFVLKTVSVSYTYLVWLGVKPYFFRTLDYFPLFPWFGVLLVGIAAGNFFYPEHRRRIRLRELPHLEPLCFIGRHSLTIYLIHQPVLLFMMWILGKVI